MRVSPHRWLLFLILLVSNPSFSEGPSASEPAGPQLAATQPTGETNPAEFAAESPRWDDTSTPVSPEPPRPTVSLHYAARTGNLKQLQSHFFWGCDVNAWDRQDCTPLYYAAKQGRIEAIKVLLEHDADIEATSTDKGWTPLLVAIAEGQTKAVEFLLERGGRVDARMKSGESAVVLAVIYDKPDALKLLIARAPEADRKTLATSFLTTAASYGHETVIDVLLAAGADVNGDEQGTPLDAAIRTSQTKVAERLLAAGADAKRLGGSRLCDVILYSNSKLATLLLSAGLDVNAVAKKNESRRLIHCAVENGDLDVVRRLVELGADVNAVEGSYRTPLMLATEDNHVEIVRYLLSHGARVSQDPDRVQQLLQSAVQQGHSELVGILLERGPRVKAHAKAGFLFTAASNGNKELVEVLLAHGANVNAVHLSQTALGHATDSGHSETVDVLLARGADPKRLGSWKLPEAIRRGRREIAISLLKAGIDPNGRHFQLPFHTAMQAAADRSDVELLNALLDRGASVNGEDDGQKRRGDTPLMLATANGSKETVEFLLSRGADIHATGEGGKIALHRAVENGYADLVEILLAHGADPNAGDAGASPIDLAREHGYEDIVKMLSESAAARKSTSQPATAPAEP